MSEDTLFNLYKISSNDIDRGRGNFAMPEKGRLVFIIIPLLKKEEIIHAEPFFSFIYLLLY